MVNKLPKEKHLSDKAKESLAEDKYFGSIPRDKLDILWSDMIMALEQGRLHNFIEVSRDVQSLVRVILNSDSQKVRNRLTAARYCVAKENKELSIASKLVEESREILEKNGVNITSVAVT